MVDSEYDDICQLREVVVIFLRYLMSRGRIRTTSSSSEIRGLRTAWTSKNSIPIDPTNAGDTSSPSVC